MMRWPWTSVARLDDMEKAHLQLVAQVQSENTRLVEQNRELLDSLTRLERFKAGMAEVPREERPKLEPMPQRLQDYYNAFAHKGSGQLHRSEAYRRNARGTPWQKIVEDTLPPKEEANDAQGR